MKQRPLQRTRSMPRKLRWTGWYSFPARLALYMILTGLALKGIVELTVKRGWREVLEEGGWVESFQLAVLCVSLVAISVLLLRCKSRRGLFSLFACMLFWEILRELDFVGTRQLIPYWPPAWLQQALTLLSLGVIVVVDRRNLPQEIREFLSRPTALLFIIGFLLVAVWGQVLGLRELWHELQRGQSAASKRFVEEGLEAAGYCFILFGFFEEWLDVRVLSRRKTFHSANRLFAPAPHFSQCDRMIERDRNVAE